jgi:hypothetical protein
MFPRVAIEIAQGRDCRRCARYPTQPPESILQALRQCHENSAAGALPVLFVQEHQSDLLNSRRKSRKSNALGSEVFTYAGSNQNHRRRRFRIICTNAACAQECAGTKVAGLHQDGFVEASGAMMTALVPHYVAAIATVQSTPTAARQEEAQPRKLPAINIWRRPGPEDSN